MTDTKTIEIITKYSLVNLDLKGSGKGWEYYYASMPLCVVDSVFSIGVKYEGVTNTVSRLVKYYNIGNRAKRKHTIPDKKDQISTTKFLSLFGDNKAEFLSKEVFGNKQRTSTTNGILKVEAVLRFLNVLKDFNIEYYQDIEKVINNNSFDFCIKNIPGQKSGISLKYFLMLSGSKDLIKPDRMVLRFLETATGKKYSLDDCQTVLTAVTNEINKLGYDLTPQLLDNAIWNFQRVH